MKYSVSCTLTTAVGTRGGARQDTTQMPERALVQTVWLRRLFLSTPPLTRTVQMRRFPCRPRHSWNERQSERGRQSEAEPMPSLTAERRVLCEVPGG